MPDPVCVARPAAPFGDPSPETCLQVAGEAALLAVIAADDAMAAVCRSRAANAEHREAVMHATHQEAVEAARHADRAEQYAADPEMPTSALVFCARKAVDHAVRAQTAAGVETTAADLRARLERVLTPVELAERESTRRREQARHEADQRAATGMDRENRELAASNRYLAEHHVAELGWTAGHLRVLEAAETGRLYWRDGRARLAAQYGVWNGGRRVSQERTQALLSARFLTATANTNDGVRVLTPSPMGQVALELARLHQDGLHINDQTAYEARFARVRRRYKRRDDQKAAARRLPPLDPSAQNLYRRPATVAEQQAFALRTGKLHRSVERLRRGPAGLAEQQVLPEHEPSHPGEDESGYCPAVEPPRPAAAPAEVLPAPTATAMSSKRAVQPSLW
ncbi:hypothetical protein [Streptomyces sp. CBMA123]|uniref:hypothetical protein n=1 Tax=Streptomyces sp. CBMA123 TaxID=1896313 RepID=UPI00166203AD|nr:hypothetical protein [Streptomyces sp. CBMA123]MBD0688536.1 hypothetical protein [Streptomyces sp. CBMA123]